MITGEPQEPWHSDTNKKFNAIIIMNWTAMEEIAAGQRAADAAIDHEAYVLWLTDVRA